MGCPNGNVGCVDVSEGQVWTGEARIVKLCICVIVER